jgi:hypothetical protein
MPIVEVSSSRPDVQRHVEVALSLAPAMKTNVAAATPSPITTTARPLSWPDVTADWLDTPAAHCSPLDDY